MNTISVTELRRNPGKLLYALDKGAEVTILYRSKVLGVVKPLPKPKKLLSKKDLSELKVLLGKIRPKKLIPRSKREKMYLEHLEEDYGSHISGHKHINRYLRA